MDEEYDCQEEFMNAFENNEKNEDEVNHEGIDETLDDIQEENGIDDVFQEPSIQGRSRFRYIRRLMRPIMVTGFLIVVMNLLFFGRGLAFLILDVLGIAGKNIQTFDRTMYYVYLGNDLLAIFVSFVGLFSGITLCCLRLRFALSILYVVLLMIFLLYYVTVKVVADVFDSKQDSSNYFKKSIYLFLTSLMMGGVFGVSILQLIYVQQERIIRNRQRKYSSSIQYTKMQDVNIEKRNS